MSSQYDMGPRRGKSGGSNTVSARQARVAFNAKPDRKTMTLQQVIHEKGSSSFTRYYDPMVPVNDLLLRINQGDMCFSYNNAKLPTAETLEYRNNNAKRRKTSRTARNEPVVFSAANGLFIHSDDFMKDNPEHNKAAARNSVKFVGFSDTDYKIDLKNKDLQKTGIAIQKKGTLTILNTGTKTIKAFDKVVWDIPDWQNRPVYSGIDNKAMKFATLPYDPYNQDLAARIDKVHDKMKKMEEKEKNDFKDMHEVDGIPQTVEEFVVKGDMDFTALFHLAQEQDSRVIGIALTTAQPGEEMDILA